MLQLFWTEYFMAVVQFSTAITELFQLLVDGLSTYFESVWNWFKCFGVISFWMGFSDIWARVQAADRCAASAEACAATGTGEGIDRSDAEYGHTMYSLCLFFMWLRVLRLISVNKDLGPLVVVIGRMGRDMCVFGVIWMVLLLAFSSALYGTMIQEDHSSHRYA